MKSGQFTYNFLLHFTVFLLGFTGILGRLITVPSDILVWYRTAIAAAGMGILLLVSRTSFRVAFRDAALMMGIGLVVAIHWITFFGSIKLSNVSITLLCLSSTTFFVAIMEPLVFRTRISWLEIILGVVIIAALSLILIGQLFREPEPGDTSRPESLTWGIVVGLISALLSGVFTIMNKKVAGRFNGSVLTFYEMIGGFIGISLYFAFSGPQRVMTPLTTMDWIWLLVLGLICTTFAFWAMLIVLKKVSAYTVVLAINMEPVYGFIMAALWFGENKVLGAGFYVGAVVIMASIFAYSLLKSRQRTTAGG